MELTTDALSVITRDGLPVAVVAAGEVLATLHRLCPGSAEYAVTHAGFSVLEARPAVFPKGDTGHGATVRGARAYLELKAGRAPRGATPWDRFVVDSLEAFGRLVDGDVFPDYLGEGEVVAPMLSALIYALGNGTHALGDIAGLLDSAVRTLAGRAGLSAADVDAL